MDERPLILLVVPDLMLGSRVLSRAGALDFRVESAETMVDAERCLESRPDLLVVDLQGEGIDALTLIAAAKANAVPVIAFGRHTEPEALRTARAAGSDAAVARSTLVEELPQLLRAHVRRGAG